MDHSNSNQPSSSQTFSIASILGSPFVKKKEERTSEEPAKRSSTDATSTPTQEPHDISSHQQNDKLGCFSGLHSTNKTDNSGQDPALLGLAGLDGDVSDTDSCLLEPAAGDSASVCSETPDHDGGPSLGTLLAAPTPMYAGPPPHPPPLTAGLLGAVAAGGPTAQHHAAGYGPLGPLHLLHHPGAATAASPLGYLDMVAAGHAAAAAAAAATAGPGFWAYSQDFINRQIFGLNGK